MPDEAKMTQDFNLESVRIAYGMSQAKAIQAVGKAVKSGDLPSLKMVSQRCADCFDQARYWDHRDYRYPLWVEVVCQPCNVKRGRAKW